MLTAYQMVWMSAERQPDGLAIVDDKTDRSLTYGELIREVDEIAAGLQAKGIGEGDVVVTALPSLYDHCLLLLALARLAAVPALLNFRLNPEELAQLAGDANAKAAVIMPDPAVAEALKGVLPDGAPVWSIGELDDAEPFSGCRGDILSLLCPDPAREDPAFIFYTSGTTGLPKGVLISHRTTEHRILWLSTQAGLRHGAHLKTLGFMPLSHAIGFYGVFLVTLAMNGSYYVMSAFNPVEAVDMIEQHKISYMFSVPQLYFAMTKAPNYAPEKMASTELVLYGGAAIPPALLDHMDEAWAADVRHIYGTTETMCSLYNPTPVGQPARLRPGFYSRTRIVKIGGGHDDLVKPGEEGELIVDATVDTIFTEYLNRPDATAEKLRDGWYYTGDVCLLHEDGDVDLIGRTDDIIRSGGENLHPGEIEDVLAQHPGVKEVSVIGVPHEKWGEAVTACVVGEAGAMELDQFVREQGLAGFKAPKAYLSLKVLPRNAANKVLRRELKTTAEAARSSGDAAYTEI